MLPLLGDWVTGICIVLEVRGVTLEEFETEEGTKIKKVISYCKIKSVRGKVYTAFTLLER